MKIECTARDNTTIVTVLERMDGTTGPDFEAQCTKLVEEGKLDVVVDFTGLEYISSAGLRAVLASAKKLKAAGGNLRFCGLQGVVKEVFRISGFLNMFTIAPTVDELLGA